MSSSEYCSGVFGLGFYYLGVAHTPGGLFQITLAFTQQQEQQRLFSLLKTNCLTISTIIFFRTEPTYVHASIHFPNTNGRKTLKLNTDTPPRLPHMPALNLTLSTVEIDCNKPNITKILYSYNCALPTVDFLNL